MLALLLLLRCNVLNARCCCVDIDLQGDLVAAEDACVAALQECPTYARALHLRAVIAKQQGQLPLALQYITQALDLQVSFTNGIRS